MNRLLLALIALLTGLAAQAAPAQARVGANETEIGLVAAERIASSVASQSAALELPAPRLEKIERASAAFRLADLAAPVPAVQLGSDRARE